MVNKKILALAVSVLLSGSGSLTYGKTTNAFAEETSIATAKMNFAMAMDKKYAEINSVTPMSRNVINTDDLISQAFLRKAKKKNYYWKNFPIVAFIFLRQEIIAY